MLCSQIDVKMFATVQLVADPRKVKHSAHPACGNLRPISRITYLVEGCCKRL